MKKSIYGFIIAIGIVTPSCINILGKVTGLSENTTTLEKINVPNKEVYFLGMRHLGKKEFYESAEKTIKEYQDKGFVFYLEGINKIDSSNFSNDNPRYIKDTLSHKKIRRILGIDLANKYSEIDNPILDNLVTKYSLIDQPKYYKLGVKNYVWVDIPLSELIKKFESTHGTVNLTTCDSVTDLKAPYVCGIANKITLKQFKNEIIKQYRNEHIVNTIKNSTDKKIVIIYGILHYKGIVELLKVN